LVAALETDEKTDQTERYSATIDNERLSIFFTNNWSLPANQQEAGASSLATA